MFWCSMVQSFTSLGLTGDAIFASIHLIHCLLFSSIANLQFKLISAYQANLERIEKCVIWCDLHVIPQNVCLLFFNTPRGYQWYLWKETCSRLTLWGSGWESTGAPLCTGGVAPARIHWICGGSSEGLATSPANICKYLAPREYWGNSWFRKSASSFRSLFRWSSK